MDDEQWINLDPTQLESDAYYYGKYRNLGYGIIGDNPKDMPEAFRNNNRELVRQLLDRRTWAFMHHVVDVSIISASVS